MSLIPGARNRPSAGESRQLSPGVFREIAILRDLILRINDLAEEETTLPELRRVLDSLSRASERLVKLLYAQKSLHDNKENASALQDALAEMLKRFDKTGSSDSGA